MTAERPLWTRELAGPRLSRVDLFPPSNYVHQLRLTDAGRLDDELASWLRAAHQAGLQAAV